MASRVYLDFHGFATVGCALPFAFADRLRKPAIREHVELDGRGRGRKFGGLTLLGVAIGVGRARPPPLPERKPLEHIVDQTPLRGVTLDLQTLESHLFICEYQAIEVP